MTASKETYEENEAILKTKISSTFGNKITELATFTYANEKHPETISYLRNDLERIFNSSRHLLKVFNFLDFLDFRCLIFFFDSHI